MREWMITTGVWATACLALAHAQCLEGDCYDGHGTYQYPSGALYKGQFKNGMIHGFGTLKFSNGDRYEGQWQRQYREGQGQLFYADGAHYEGDFVRSRLQGKGLFRYANGDAYQGEFQADLPEGEGRLDFAAGGWYAGQFKAGAFHGQGTRQFADGSRYEGQWADNQQHGSGRFTSSDGRSQEGRWENGQIANAQSPEQQNLAEAGSLPDCTFGNCDGIVGVFHYADGARYVGQFISGEPQGQGTLFYNNGDKYVGGWANHAPHGAGIMYYTDGRVRGAVWQYGMPVGELNSSHVGQVGEEHISVQRDPSVRVWAVVVGVGEYAHLPRLKYTDDDAYAFYAFLRSPEGGAVPDAQIRLLIDEEANHFNVVRAMRQTFLQADENDVVMLYYSGHGLPGAFVPVDYDGFHNKLHHETVLDLFEKSLAKHKLCFADACHAGTLREKSGERRRAGVEATISRYYEAFERSKGGVAYFMSSRGEEVSLEDGGLRQSIFTHFLLRGLRGEADTDRDGIITVSELDAFVRQQVPDYTLNLQNPVFDGKHDRHMPVAVAAKR